MKVYIYNAKRSPIGKYKKSLRKTGCREIGTQVVKGLFNSRIKPKMVDKLIAGNVLSAGLGQNIARQILIDSDIPQEKCAVSINMVCGSGLKAINYAFYEIKMGNAHCVVAGGVENMSMAPVLVDKDEEVKETKDCMLYDSLTDTFSNKHMGITAENVAEKYGISREEQDMFALESQKKACKAIQRNRFKKEIIPIELKNGNIFLEDEYPRPDSSLEALKKLKPAFKENGTVTAGNASGINDGGAFMVIGDETLKAKPLVEIVDFAEAGCDADYMGFAPYYAISALLEKTNVNIRDVGLFEINEAFASQSIAVIRELAKKYKLNEKEFKKKINVNGGAIALGHPVGASGARILTTLVYEMKRRKVKYGIASLCIGGGMGIAVLVKNIGV